MRGADHFPSGVVEVCGFGSCGIAEVVAPALVEVIYHTVAALKGEETGYRGPCGSGWGCRKEEEKQKY